MAAASEFWLFSGWCGYTIVLQFPTHLPSREIYARRWTLTITSMSIGFMATGKLACEKFKVLYCPCISKSPCRHRVLPVNSVSLGSEEFRRCGRPSTRCRNRQSGLRCCIFPGREIFHVFAPDGVWKVSEEYSHSNGHQARDMLFA